MSCLYLQYKCNTSGEYIHTPVLGLIKAIQMCNILDATKVTQVCIYRLKDGAALNIHRHYVEGEKYGQHESSAVREVTAKHPIYVEPRIH